jgi:hypothetical protein
MKTRADFQSVELDWFAADESGFVALMSSAGYGPIPDCVFQKFEQQRQIEEQFSKLVGFSTSGDLIRAKRSLSKLGVFSYDWKHWKGPYRRIGFPLRPRRMDTLGFSAELRDSFALLPKRFWLSWRMRPETLLPCTS